MGSILSEAILNIWYRFNYHHDFFFFLRILFIYSREGKSASRSETEGEGEADPRLSREPNKELNPRPLGLQPQLKADTQKTEPPRHPYHLNFKEE